MVVGALKLILHVSSAGGLKPKRKVARSVIDKVRARFNAAVAEVGANDLWQRLEIGFCVCGNQVSQVQEQIKNITSFVESLGLAELVDVRLEIMNLKEMTWIGEYGLRGEP